MRNHKEPVEAPFGTHCGLCLKMVWKGEPAVQFDGDWCHPECVEEEFAQEQHARYRTGM